MDEHSNDMSMEESSQPLENQEEGIALQVEGDQVHFGPGFAISVTANQDASVTQGGAIAIAVGRDAKIEQGGGQVIAVGHDLEIESGGGGYMRVGGSATLKNSVAVISVSQQVDAQESTLGVVFARQVNLGEGSRVLINTPQALLIGILTGLVCGLISFITRKRD